MGGNSCKFENSMKTHFMIVARIKHIYTTDKLQLEKWGFWITFNIQKRVSMQKNIKSM